jgi:hypothetical protein
MIRSNVVHARKRPRASIQFPSTDQVRLARPCKSSARRSQVNEGNAPCARLQLLLSLGPWVQGRLQGAGRSRLSVRHREERDPSPTQLLQKRLSVVALDGIPAYTYQEALERVTEMA